MTTLREKVVEVDRLMAQIKTSWVADQPDETDLLIYVHVYRDENIVAALQCPLDRDTALKACQLAAVGMAADVLITTFESWHSRHPKSPVTGKDWEPGEMGFVGQTMPEAREKGWVNECLTTNGYDRQGNYALVSRPYLIENYEVSYGELEVMDSDEPDFSGGGLMHEVFVEIMKIETMKDKIASATEETAAIKAVADMIPDEETRDFHMDCASLKALADQELIVSAILMAEDNTTRQKLIESRFGEESRA